MSEKPPPPLEWHPAYRDKTWLLDWLNGTGRFAHLHTIRVPITPQIRIEVRDPDPFTIEEIRFHTLVRKRAFGQAPYVGRPFIYVWRVGVDELGRSIASDSRIVYLDDSARRLGGLSA